MAAGQQKRFGIQWMLSLRTVVARFAPPRPTSDDGRTAKRASGVRLLNEAEFLQGKKQDSDSRLPAQNS